MVRGGGFFMVIGLWGGFKYKVYWWLCKLYWGGGFFVFWSMLCFLVYGYFCVVIYWLGVFFGFLFLKFNFGIFFFCECCCCCNFYVVSGLDFGGLWVFGFKGIEECMWVLFCFECELEFGGWIDRMVMESLNFSF